MKNVKVREANRKKYIFCQPDVLLIENEQDILDLIGLAGENDTNLMLFHAGNFAPEFYDLKSGLAGTILQKFSNYQITAAIIGDFTNVSQHFRELIGECNRGNQLRFFEDISQATEWLTI